LEAPIPNTQIHTKSDSLNFNNNKNHPSSSSRRRRIPSNWSKNVSRRKKQTNKRLQLRFSVQALLAAVTGQTFKGTDNLAKKNLAPDQPRRSS
jgi:hypothetical protein